MSDSIQLGRGLEREVGRVHDEDPDRAGVNRSQVARRGRVRGDDQIAVGGQIRRGEHRGPDRPSVLGHRTPVG
jgi:hypothetical protein